MTDEPNDTTTNTPDDAAQRLAELGRTIEGLRAELGTTKRRHAIDLALIESEAVDLEAARLLAEAALGEEPDADITGAVADLRRRKPFLFRQPRPRPGATAPLRAGHAAPDDAEDLAAEAARTGDRRALLRYLEARRRN